jgi:hypothetical protein
VAGLFAHKLVSQNEEALLAQPQQWRLITVQGQRIR